MKTPLLPKQADDVIAALKKAGKEIKSLQGRVNRTNKADRTPVTADVLCKLHQARADQFKHPGKGRGR